MDIKHLFSTQPFGPVYVERPPDDHAQPTPQSVAIDVRRHRRHRTRRRRLRLRQRGSPAPGAPRGLPDRRAGGDRRRMARVHGRRRLPAAGAVAVRRLGPGPARRAGTHRPTGTSTTVPGRPSRCPGDVPSCRPSRSVTSPSTRPTPSPDGPAPGCLPSSSGRPRRGNAPSYAGSCSIPTGSIRAGPGRRWSATCGSGRPRPTCPIPRFAPANGAVGEYNGKFMCDQHVLRGGLRGHPGRARAARPTATSSRLRPLGVQRPAPGPRNAG